MFIATPMFNLICHLPFFVWSELFAIFISSYAILLLYKKRAQECPFLYGTKHFLVTIITASILEDLAWLMNTLRLTVLPNLNPNLVLLLIRTAWILAVLQYQAFSLFIEHLIPSQSKFLLLINRLTSLVCMIYSACFLWVILFSTGILQQSVLELAVIENITTIYMPIMISICLFFTLLALTNSAIPSNLRKILYVFALGLIGPTILVDTIHIYQPSILKNNYLIDHDSLIGFFAMFIALAALCCIQQILKQPSADDEL